MNKGRAVPFVAGFVCGVVALLLGLAVTHIGWPRPAGASPTAPAAPRAQQIAKPVVRQMENRAQLPPHDANASHRTEGMPWGYRGPLPPRDPNAGWWYDPETGEFVPND